jgi:hypothetical protein
MSCGMFMWPLDHSRAASIFIACQIVDESEEPDKRKMLLARDILPTCFAESQPVLLLSVFLLAK